MKKCMRCHKNDVSNQEHDLCHNCWKEQESKDKNIKDEEHFDLNLLFKEVHTVYAMFYDKKEVKIGYTNDLKSRLIEIKRQYPNNKLVYFREFVTEIEARKFEKWLKELTERDINKFIAEFQDKLKKVENL